jgi:hypothetical protein
MSASMMTWPRRSITAAALAALVLAGAAGGPPAARGADPPPAKEKSAPSVWMRQKLTASQNILAALTKEDYDAITLNAKSMLVVGYLEAFARADAPGYREMLGDFAYANRTLVDAAKAKNLDRATVAYLQLTLSCVNCHKIVRDVGR